MQFDFGENWKEFSKNALTSERVSASLDAFKDLTRELSLKDQTFLDIGFGQGLSLLNATTLGAKTFGCDINPKCAEVLLENRKFYPDLKEKEIPVVVGSILVDETVQKIKAQKKEGFQVVHSWGVLHHTGEMYKAIDNSMSLVAPKGHFIIAIYNKHWSSLSWLFIKWFYCKSPAWIKKFMIYLFYPIIYLAKFIVTGQNPKKQERGMNFFYDIIDWVGGYPYEYASTKEIISYFEKKGYECIKTIPAKVPTGCNEFIFRKNLNS